MNYVVDKFRETASVMGAEKWINYELEKSKEFLTVLQPFGKICVAEVPDVVFPPLQQFGKRCVAKLDEVFPLLQRFGNLCIAKALDEVFPPLQQFSKLCIAQRTGRGFPTASAFWQALYSKSTGLRFPTALALWQDLYRRRGGYSGGYSDESDPPLLLRWWRGRIDGQDDDSSRNWQGYQDS